ncbi:hypothetical protein HOY82DRAFT_613690 [Tuber indicum]|nr:hypothetical protein HOY82DRAFT_613690 [Tuber indicum]
MTRFKLSAAICGELLLVSVTCAPLAGQDPAEPNLNVNIEKHRDVAEENGTKINPVETHLKIKRDGPDKLPPAPAQPPAVAAAAKPAAPGGGPAPVPGTANPPPATGAAAPPPVAQPPKPSTPATPSPTAASPPPVTPPVTPPPAAQPAALPPPAAPASSNPLTNLFHPSPTQPQVPGQPVPVSTPVIGPPILGALGPTVNTISNPMAHPDGMMEMGGMPTMMGVLGMGGMSGMGDMASAIGGMMGGIRPSVMPYTMTPMGQPFMIGGTGSRMSNMMGNMGNRMSGVMGGMRNKMGEGTSRMGRKSRMSSSSRTEKPASPSTDTDEDVDDEEDREEE